MGAAEVVVAVAVAADRLPAAGAAEPYLGGFPTLGLRLQAIRRRRLLSFLSGAGTSALWVAGLAALVAILGAGFLDIR